MNTNRKIRFNTSLLERLAGKSAPDGAKTKVLMAMNADRRRHAADTGRMDRGEIRYKTLDRWLRGKDHIPTFLDAIISYCNNNHEGITLGDFFIYEDDTPADIAMSSPANPISLLTSKIELLLKQMELQQQQIEILQTKLNIK